MKPKPWMHGVLVGCAIGSAIAEALAQYQGALPWHLTAGFLLAVSSTFGLISKSITEVQ
jgi:F0F1-type ATP synthase assembly protein I